jgi:undecaprenyl-diphosphatase
MTRSCRVDRSVYEGLQGVRTGWIDDIMVTLTALGSAYVTVAVIVAVAVWLGVVRRWQTLAYWIGAVAFAEVLVWALKYGWNASARIRTLRSWIRTRFQAATRRCRSSSTDSSHSCWAMARAAGRRPRSRFRRWRSPALIAFSRLYLGAHWFSDVMASLGLGLAWIGLLCIAYLHHVHEKPLRALPMSIVVFTVFVFFGTLYAHRYHERDLALYAKPANARTLTFAGWMSGEWQGLPAARSEFRGEREEPFFPAMGGNGGSGACRARERAMAGAGGVGIGCDAAVARSHDADRPVAGAAEVPPGPAAGADVRSRRRCSQSRRDPPVARRNRHQAG